MIAEIIPRKSKALRTTKSDVSRFVNYVCAKAITVQTRNLLPDWHDADWQMWAVANGNMRAKTLTYHFSLCWEPTERPTCDQMIAAADKALIELGIAEHQAVIAIHDDRRHQHIHIGVNRAHPVTFDVFNTTQDFAKLEKICRQIELVNGWPADRGRFNPVIVETPAGPQIELAPPTDVQSQAKQRRRAAGRGTAQNDLSYERRTGTVPLIQALSHRWKERIKYTLDKATSWPVVHASLANIGLILTRVPSGTRLALRGSHASFAPSQLGARFGYKQMVARLGRWRDAAAFIWPQAPHSVPGSNMLRRRPQDDDAEPPQLTDTGRMLALTQTYTHLTANRAVTDQIVSIALDCATPCVTLTSGTVVQDIGDAIATTSTSTSVDKVDAQIALTMGVAKGWASFAVLGSKTFIHAVCDHAADAGLKLAQGSRDADAVQLRREPQILPSRPVTAPDSRANDKMQLAQIARRAQQKAERADLLSVQRDERNKLNGLIKGDRGLHARAMRQGLSMHHDDQRRTLKAQQLQRENVKQSFATPAVSSALQGRTERIAQRVDAGLETGGPLQGWTGAEPLDHTACRQLWDVTNAPEHWLSSSDESLNPAMSFEGRPLDYRWVKKDGLSLLLCAHRDDNESIIGFEYAFSGLNGEMHLGIGLGGQKAVHILNGPRVNARVVVSAWGFDALGIAHEEGRPDTTYVSIGGVCDARTRKALALLLRGKNVIDGFDETPLERGLFAELQAIHPAAQPRYAASVEPAQAVRAEPDDDGPSSNQSDHEWLRDDEADPGPAP